MVKTTPTRSMRAKNKVFHHKAQVTSSVKFVDVENNEWSINCSQHFTFLHDWLGSGQNRSHLVCHHSSVDSSVPSILPPWVRLPSTPSMLLSFMVKFVLYLSLQCEKRTKINKIGRIWPIFKKPDDTLLHKSPSW